MGGAWQYAAGAPDAARVHPKLFEAFGAETRPDDFGGFGGSGSNTAAFADPTGALAEEVPRVFSAKAQGSLAGDLGFQTSGFGGGFASAGGASASQPLAASALPYGDPCWVTVFGFPGRAAALVRQQLEALCGPIVEVCHGDGNFMHVRFHGASAANACLAQNGRPILGKLLIGCVPCTSGLGGAGQAMDESEEAEPPFRPGPKPAAGMPWPLAAGATPGPKVTRGGFLGRLLDLLFDI